MMASVKRDQSPLEIIPELFLMMKLWPQKCGFELVGLFPKTLMAGLLVDLMNVSDFINMIGFNLSSGTEIYLTSRRLMR